MGDGDGLILLSKFSLVPFQPHSDSDTVKFADIRCTLLT